MQSEAVQDILQEINTHVEGLDQMAIVRPDGTPVVQLRPDGEALQIEDSATELAALAERVCGMLNRGPNTEALIKGQHRFLAFYRSHQADFLLAIVGASTVNFGLLNSSSRSALQKLEALPLSS